MTKDSFAKAKAEAQKMFDCPQDNWSMEDVQRLASRAGLTMKPPKRGSHFTVSSPHIESIQTVPYNRPIKAVYIKRFATMVRQHIAALEEDNGN